MIVEDEEIVLEDIRESVEKMGYSVCATASSGREAIDKAGMARPDLILMDILLKGSMDGIEAAKQIGERYRIPVVYLTAFGEDSMLDRAKIAEPYGYVLKPFQTRELHIAIEVALYKKEAETRLQMMEHRLYQARKEESLGRMAGGIAHHFNNQLGVVMGNLELALWNLPQESVVRAIILESMKASRRAVEMSRLMLAYIGQTKELKGPLDLAQLVRETIPLLDASMPGQVRLKTKLPPQGPIILGDAVNIKHVVTNLVSNAVEAVAENEGSATVAVQVTAAEDMRGLRFFPLDWQPEATRYACLSVADTGCGMDEADMEKIFDPFFSTKFTGRGLGLPVTLGLVRAHDGAISVESTPGQGAVFRVFFPLLTEESVPSSKEEPPLARLAKVGGLVLVVDDEPGMRDMAQAILKKILGHEAITAGDGYDAMEIFRARKDEIDLVLLDLSMPGMDGWETLAQLRAVRPDIPVVLASGHDEAQVMQGHHPHRPQAFIHKPYMSEDLREAIAAAKKPASVQHPRGCEIPR
jgi:CheY-like chemotaxis protein